MTVFLRRSLGRVANSIHLLADQSSRFRGSEMVVDRVTNALIGCRMPKTVIMEGESIRL